MILRHSDYAQDVISGEPILDFKGKEWVYVIVTRLPGLHSSGKIMVRDHEDNVREFYDSVFPDYRIVTYDRGCASGSCDI